MGVSDPQPTGPLSNVTVIDCTMALSGPYGTALLGDLGADVIKVEPPGGDGSRRVPPFPPGFERPGQGGPGTVDFGAFFASINRNKRSVVLNLKHDGDREILLRLVERADAIVENMRAGVMDKLGVGYEAVSARNPTIVYGCIRGFGDPRTGLSPYADWPGYDVVAQSMAGHVHLTGPPDGGPGYPAGVSVGDIFPGTLLALGLVSAILHARETGEGQFFDVAMYDAMLAFTETLVANYGFDRTELSARGRHHPNLMPFGIFPTHDGGVAIAAPGANHWHALCDAMARPDLKEDPRTRTALVRRENQEYVEGAISAWTSSRSKRDVVATLGGKVPCGPVNTAADIFRDPHVRAREMIAEFELPGSNGHAAIVGSPIKFEKTKTGVHRRPPRLGEHGEEVLHGLRLGSSVK
ncbi:MAG: CoA transferase [Gammaproteobacteria bacterium]|nr:CoA transferase [Gammaproteobacteria bacterium]